MKLGDIEKLAVEVADLANREAALNAEHARVLEELSAVRTAKSQKLQRLASGGNGSAPPASTAPASGTTDAKERVYRMVTADPSRVVTIQDVHKSLGMNRNTASVYLSELAKEGRITRLTKGRYQALPTGHQAVPVKATPVKNDAAVPARILALFASEPSVKFTAPSIGKRFGVHDESGINTIRGALSRLSRDKKIEKVGRGGYKAVSAK